MSRIDITTSAAPLSDGMLQTANPLDATLQVVTDNVGNSSTVSLSTTETQINSILRIKTDNAELLDIENSSGNRFNINRDVQKINLDFASNPTGSTSIVGAIRTFIDGTNLSDVAQFQENGQVTFTERVKLESDSTVTTQTSSVIQSSTTNANLVIAPNGTGALVANIPDGLISGGDARGINAVDFQMSRTASAQVASGNYSTVLNGIAATASGALSLANGTATASGTYSVALGGRCFASGSGSVAIGGEDGGGLGATASARAAVAFGLSNTASATFSNALGGLSNTASSSFSVVSGGQSNTASTNGHATVAGGQSNTASGTHSTVVGGQSNTASGQHSVAGGQGNTVSGNFASVVLGYQNNVSGQRSGAIGYQNNITTDMSFAAGRYNRVTGYASVAICNGGFTYLAGQFSQQANTDGTNQGERQTSVIVPYKTDALTTAATTVLSLDGTGVTELIIPSGSNRAWNVQVNWVAIVTTITGTATGISVGDVVTSIDLLAFKKIGGVSSASAHTSTATKLMVTTPAAYAACAIAFTAGASQEMALTFTGPTFVGGGSVTMRVVARIELTEVAF